MPGDQIPHTTIATTPWHPIASNIMQPVIIYSPSAEYRFRVAWYGGESTQLHFEKLNICDEWIDRDVRTLGGGIPSSIKDMLLVMENYYHEAIIMEEERKYQMM
jgi:hypothetical protein